MDVGWKELRIIGTKLGNDLQHMNRGGILEHKGEGEILGIISLGLPTSL